MNQGTLVAVNGKIYEYDRYDERLKIHIVAEIDIDSEGFLTQTYIPYAFTDAEFALSEDGTDHFTKDQWYGIVAHFIREGDFDLNEEEMEDATEDIVERCFICGIPKIHELEGYIAEYMNR